MEWQHVCACMLIIDKVMLNKNTLGVKKCEAKKKQHYKWVHMQQKALISTKAKKLFTKILLAA